MSWGYGPEDGFIKGFIDFNLMMKKMTRSLCKSDQVSRSIVVFINIKNLDRVEVIVEFRGLLELSFSSV